MRPISKESVEETWEKLAALPPERAMALMDEMVKQQPVIIAYMMATADAYLNEDEQELLIYLGFAIWQIVCHGVEPPHSISEETLDACESKNLSMLEYLAGEADADFADTVEKIFHSYPQPEVLRYIVECLIEETNDAGVHVSDDGRGHMLICLKTVLDCFNTAIN